MNTIPPTSSAPQTQGTTPFAAPPRGPAETFHTQPPVEAPQRPPLNWRAAVQRAQANLRNTDKKALIAAGAASIFWPPLGAGLACYFLYKGSKQHPAPPNATGPQRVQNAFASGNDAFTSTVDRIAGSVFPAREAQS